jgi:hypothetical protein
MPLCAAGFCTNGEAAVGAAAGLERGLVPVPAWVIAALGGFIVIAALAYLTLQLLARRRRSR